MISALYILSTHLSKTIPAPTKCPGHRVPNVTTMLCMKTFTGPRRQDLLRSTTHGHSDDLGLSSCFDLESSFRLHEAEPHTQHANAHSQHSTDESTVGEKEPHAQHPLHDFHHLKTSRKLDSLSVLQCSDRFLRSWD